MAAKLLRYLLLYPLLLVLAGAALFLAWLGTRAPLSALPPPQHGIVASRASPVIAKARHIEHIILPSSKLGDIGFTLSLPEPLPAKKLPILIVLGGLGTGENNIRMIANAGDNAIVGYDWPMPVDFPSGRELIKATPDLARRVMSIAGQIASSIDWLAAQPWADDKRISILGYSLGALAAPAAEYLTENDGHEVKWTIIAYGGAPFGALFASNPHMKPKWLGPVADLLLHPLQPTVNLPHLSSHFLVLEGQDDLLIPAEARDTLQAAVPDPKDVVVFSGGHMGVGPDKQVLLGQIIRTSREWLIRNGATNPPPAP